MIALPSIMVAAAFTVAVAGYAGHASEAAVTKASRVGLGIVVPAYWYPGTSSWKILASMHNPHRWPGGKSPRTVSEAIFNPCAPNGKTCSPGNAPNPAARKDMRAAQKNGITFYGYVWTGGGQVSAAAVKAKIREYASWYDLRDIFLDGASTKCAKAASYYRPLRIAIVHTTRNSAAMTKAVAEAAQHDHIGNVYVTNLHMPNPYQKLPAYWNQEVAKVSKTPVR